MAYGVGEVREQLLTAALGDVLVVFQQEGVPEHSLALCGVVLQGADDALVQETEWGGGVRCEEEEALVEVTAILEHLGGFLVTLDGLIDVGAGAAEALEAGDGGGVAQAEDVVACHADVEAVALHGLIEAEGQAELGADVGPDPLLVTDDAGDGGAAQDVLAVADALVSVPDGREDHRGDGRDGLAGADAAVKEQASVLPAPDGVAHPIAQRGQLVQSDRVVQQLVGIGSNRRPAQRRSLEPSTPVVVDWV